MSNQLACRTIALNLTKKNSDINIDFSGWELSKFFGYSLEKYISDVSNYGLARTWDLLCQYVLNVGENKDFLNIQNFGEMYEIGLAIQDKLHKKNSGQYYTPSDVAIVMSKWFDKLEGENICDVACGTGKLILSYLEYIGRERAYEIILGGRLYLYDFDEIALKICKTSIMVKYGIKNGLLIHDVCCDFLNQDVILPNNAKVIANPPYATIKQVGHNWLLTPIIAKTTEFYAAFMEKIISQATSTVIITPFSFIAAKHYYLLRKMMCDIGNGFVVSFDNVPGNIFCGRKHGIFNTNTANSVRAAITVLRRDEVIKGFKVSPLIRFKNEEREAVLDCDVLEKMLPNEYQVVNDQNPMFDKVNSNLFGLFLDWKEKSEYTLENFLVMNNTQYVVNVPNTCRYFTTGAKKKLNRKGLMSLCVNNADFFSFIYCVMNSSFAYWWWRIYDGGITYPVGLLKKMPIPWNLLTNDDKLFFKNICTEMTMEEHKYVVVKKNAGVDQENIKFPTYYREKINQRLLKLFNCEHLQRELLSVHANCFFVK